MTNPLGSGVTRYIDGRDKQLAAVVFQALKPPLDSELNLMSLMDLEARAEQVRSSMASGWLMNESNPMGDYATGVNWSNHFYFGRNTSGELRDPTWAIVNGWVIPVTGTRTGSPPLSANNSDTHNKIELNPPSTSTGGSRAEFIFLEVWQQRIDVDPASPSIAPGKPQRGYIYRFGNVESGFSHIQDDLVDPNLNLETTKRVQVQYRIRVVAGINIAQYPEGFDPTLVFAQGSLTAPSAVAFQNMREELGDSGLYRAGTGDPTTFGTVDGYVYAIPLCVVFRRNSAGFSDTGNLAGAFNRNSLATTRAQATSYTNRIYLPTDITETDVQFTLTSISGTILSTLTSFGEAYFKVDDEIIRVNNVTQTGPTSFVVSIDRGQLQTIVREHSSGKELVMYTVRPDGLYADQVTQTDILDLRHSIANKFDYDSILKSNLTNLLRGKLRTAWKRYGSTNPAGPVVPYGDRITDGTVFVGGLSRLDAPDGNRMIFSDAVVTERFSVHVTVPDQSTAIGTEMQVQVVPYNVSVEWNAAPPTHTAGNRQNGGVVWWWNGDQLKINIDDFYAGMPAADSDQVRFVLPSEDPDAVLIHFEGMTTDPNGATPVDQPWDVATNTAPTVTHVNEGSITINGNRILKDGQGIDITTDGSGNLLITLNSGTTDTAFEEFTDALQPNAPTADLATNTVMHIEFAVVYGAGRGLSHKPDYIHNAHYRGDPTNSSKVMLRPGLSDRNRMIPTYLIDSPYVQTGANRELARTSQVMIDPGSKTVWAGPYRNMLLPPLLCRDGSQLNWTSSAVFQGAMPTLDQEGVSTVHTTVDPLNLFYVGVQTRYVEIPLKFLPRPGLHHVPIMAVTNSVFPSGINWLLMSQEGPFGGIDSSDFNRNLVSYPSTAGYYIVTPETGETYGTGSLPSMFGQKYTNNNLKADDGGAFKGIQFPPFMGPARITGVYLRDTSGPAPHPTVPTSSPFNTDRVYVGGSGTDTNLLKDDYDGPTFLFLVDENGDGTFILNADALDLTKAPSGTTFDNSEFLIECTLFGFDRGFLQTNGRILIARTSGGGSLPVNVDTFTNTIDNKIGVIAPAPLTLNATNNELTVYYSRQPYQGDVFGSQNAYSDDTQKLGPLAISEANSIRSNPLGPISTLSLSNKTGYEVLAATNFITSLGTGRMSGSNPIPLLTPTQNPNTVTDYAGTLVDLNRRFSPNRVGYEDWSTPKFPVLSTAFTSRPSLVKDGISEVYDRDVNPEFIGCTSQLPLGIYFRDKDFVGKTLYQIRSASNVGVAAIGTTVFPPYQAPVNPATPGVSTWEGVEFVTGQASGTSGVGGEVVVTVDGTNSYSSVTDFKTTRGGAGWSDTGPWPGGPLASRLPKARPNAEVGSILAGTAYLVRSQPEWINTIEVHHGQELQMVIVTRAVPSYFRDTDVLHSASGTNEGFTAVDRFRVWGRPLEKRRAEIDISTALPEEEPLFRNNIYDDPIFFGSSDVSLTSLKQEVLPITSDGQTAFTLSARPVDPTTVMAFARGVKLTYGTDYTVGGTTNQDLTYIVNAANPALLTTDTLEVWYALL
jgi:hypothetical protein